MTIHDKMLKISFVRLLTSVWANLTCMHKASDLCSLTLVFFFVLFFNSLLNLSPKIMIAFQNDKQKKLKQIPKGLKY